MIEKLRYLYVMASPQVIPPVPATPSPRAPPCRWWHLVAARLPRHSAPESTVWPPTRHSTGRHSPELHSNVTNVTNLNPHLTSRSVKLLRTASDTPAADFNSLLSLLFRTSTCCWQSLKVQAISCITSIIIIEKNSLQYRQKAFVLHEMMLLVNTSTFCLQQQI